jgi:dolichyl-phosphate beta-glucosyltransferase
MYLSVIIPAYNEAKTIGSTLQSIGAWLAGQSFDAEIIVVDNRSSDATVDMVRGWMHQLPFLRLVSESRAGKGYAVRTGMLAAHGQVRLFMDSDNATTVDHFERCKSYLDQGYDVVIGSLSVPGAIVEHKEPLWRVVLGKLGNLWIQLFAVPGIWDTQRGFKVFTERAAKDIFPRLTIFGWGFDIEVLAVARLKKYKIKEIPVTWKHNPDSRVNVWAYPQVLGSTLKVFWNRLTGRYA